MKEEHKQHLEEILARVEAAGAVVPLQRQAFKKGYSFMKLPLEQQWPVWDAAWHSGNFWVMAQAYFFCETQMKKEKVLLDAWPLLKKWQERSASWETNDCLSKIYSRLLEIDPDLLYPVLCEWNKSDNPWKRRQSLVGLLYYSRTRKKILPFSKYISLVKSCLKDKEYYVQKGLGWTLRELGNAYPKETYEFLKNHVHSISAIAFSAAVEKLEKKKKENLKRLRKF